MSRLVILAALIFEISCWKTDRQTNRQTNKQISAAENPTQATTVGVSNNNLATLFFSRKRIDSSSRRLFKIA